MSGMRRARLDVNKYNLSNSRLTGARGSHQEFGHFRRGSAVSGTSGSAVVPPGRGAGVREEDPRRSAGDAENVIGDMAEPHGSGAAA